MNITEIQNNLKMRSPVDLKVLQIYAILELVKAIKEATKAIKAT